MTTSVPPERLSLHARLIVCAGGLVLVALLVVAAVLRPSPDGYGTHRQLGLPPCTFQWMFDRRCPTCGMTTAWSHVMRLELRRALAANVGGVLLAGAAVVAAPWLLISAARGRWWGRLPGDRTLAGMALGIALLSIVEWFVRVGPGWPSP